MSYSAWLADMARREFAIREGLAAVRQFESDPLDGDRARAAGALAASAGTSDIVDACVVEGALRRRDLVVSSGPGDLASIASAIGVRREVDQP
jgi:hypothetical protein